MNNTKPIINIVSCLKHDSIYIKTYFSQLENLTQNYFSLGTINVVCNLITDELSKYQACDPKIHLILETQSEKDINSLEEKAVQWAQIGNQGINQSLNDNPAYLLWLESDLCVPSDLIDQLIGCGVDVVAPIVFLGGNFYDSWGFRDLSGAKIYSVEQLKSDTNLAPMSSVGSCVLFRSEIFYQGVRFRGTYEDGLLVGICNDSRRLGYKIWCDISTSVIHPTSFWRLQVWEIVEIEIVKIKPMNIRLKNSYVAGTYNQVIIDWIKSNTSLVKILGSSTFHLRIIKDDARRELKLSFILQ